MMPALSNVISRYGAPMGRPSSHSGCPDTDARFYLQQLPMVDGDYDRGGAYWGCGNSSIGWMYRAYSEDFPDVIVEMFFRAKSREDAKAEVRDRYPNAKFFR